MAESNRPLAGKVAVVTGGSKGLGRAMVLGFAERGADVVIASRKIEPCEAVAVAARAHGVRAIAVSCHVADWAQCDALIETAVAQLGRIDILVNNAGIAPVAPTMKDITEVLFDKTIGVNLKGPLRLGAMAAEHMGEGGAIINISSVASVRPTPFTTVYAAAKAGLNVLTSIMAQEFAPKGIRANGILCGTFSTDSFNAAVPNDEAKKIAVGGSTMNRVAEAEEIVGTAVYLATNASSYVTGQMIHVDGGVLP
ncbi:MAG: SDR family NAD(P)-dependent oxidoreductase [Candidatus Binatia bacterium]|nr:SDR family NAD(P)-dependent oxidoreductase [Candidatus Binatia bacterium]